MVGNRRGEASRGALLEAGRAAFSEQRYEDVSIVDLARSLGVAAGSIGYHFGGKRGFYLAVIQQAADEFWNELSQMRGPARDRLTLGVEKLLDWADRQPRSFEALIADVADAEVRAIRDRHRRRLSHALAVEITGTESTPVLRVAISGCLSFIEGVVLQWIHGGEIARDQARDLILRNFYATVVNAVLVDPGIELSRRALDAAMSDSRLQTFLGGLSMTPPVESEAE